MRTAKWKKWAWMLLVLGIPLLIIHHFFSRILACPACYLFLDSSDGLKNYFTTAWYVVHDQGWHFSGMNYPYGENIIYTDNQPILALILRWIHRHILPLDRHVVGTMNMLMILSLYLGVLINYYLLRRWNVGKIWALISALCIIFLSPQMMRLEGHYALSYVFFFPALMLLLDKIVSDARTWYWWALGLGIFVTATSLIHLYFLLLHLLVILAFLLYWSWQQWRMHVPFRRKALALGMTMIVPGLALVLIRKLTDHVTDRPTAPWGLEYHCIDFKTTFFSFFHPFDQVWMSVFGIDMPNNEKIAYTGLIGLFMLPLVLYYFVRKADYASDKKAIVVKSFIGAALLSWCMGAGVFYLYGLKGIWEALPVLKQFRTLGRFGLPFYYLFMMACSYLLWQFYLLMRERNLTRQANYLFAVIILVWGFEAWTNTSTLSSRLSRPNVILKTNHKKYLPLLAEKGLKPDDFQAVLALPLTVIGNEMLGVTRGFWKFDEAVEASWETGLPMVNYSMSRTSVSQGLDAIELLSSPYHHKQRAEKFNDKPILLVCDEKAMIPDEKRWMEKAAPIGMLNNLTIMSLPAAAFKNIELPDTTNLTPIGRNGWYDSFEDTPCDTAFTGHGARVIRQAMTSIWSYTDTFPGTRDWTASFWTYHDNIKASSAMVQLEEKNDEGTIVRQEGFHRDAIDWSEVYGSWMEVRIPISTHGKGYNYHLYITNTGTVIDDLLIRPADDTCLIRRPGMMLYNNIPIPNAQ